MYLAVGTTFLAWAIVMWGLYFSTAPTNELSIEQAKQQLGMRDTNYEVVTETTRNADSRDRTEVVDTEDLVAPEILVDQEAMAQMPVVQQEQTQEEIEKTIDWIDRNSLPNEINLEVPFYPQAPDANWNLPWKEACEESSVIQAYHYIKWEPLTKADFKQEILELVDLQNSIFGQYIDTSMQETAEFLEAYYNYQDYEIIDNPTLEDLKYELAQGHPIVAPFAGKELWNSFFTDGWPRYHVLVIVGYNQWFFLTNDVGTSKWENFAYSYEVIMNAMHDLVRDWDIGAWEKRVLVLR